MQYNPAGSLLGLTTVRSSNIAYFDRVDHLRFFAAVSVLSFHAFDKIYEGLVKASGHVFVPANPLSVFIIEGHNSGLFLTLSGFLFARICINKQIDIKQFYVNRLLRIFPLYVTAIVFAVCVVPTSLASFLTSLCTLQFLPSAIHGVYTDHLWTVGVELQFYAIFPVLLLAYRREGLKFLMQLVVFCMLLILAVYLSTAGPIRDVVYMTLLGRLNQAVIGMMFGFSYDRIQKYVKDPIALVGSIAAMSTAMQLFHFTGGLPFNGHNPLWVFWFSLESVIWSLVFCCYQACSLKIPERIASALAYLGAISYSIYVWHYFLVYAICHWFVQELFSTHHNNNTYIVAAKSFLVSHPLETSLWAPFFLVLPPSLVLAVLSFNVIERPFMALRKKYTSALDPIEVTDSEPKVLVASALR